jgi:hypothetical protein
MYTSIVDQVDLEYLCAQGTEYSLYAHSQGIVSQMTEVQWFVGIGAGKLQYEPLSFETSAAAVQFCGLKDLGDHISGSRQLIEMDVEIRPLDFNTRRNGGIFSAKPFGDTQGYVFRRALEKGGVGKHGKGQIPHLGSRRDLDNHVGGIELVPRLLLYGLADELPPDLFVPIHR